MDITAKIAEELGIRKNQAQAAIQLIGEGNTIPFIARYRKEATGALNDEILRNLFDRLTYLRNLEEKKEQVIASIEEQGFMPLYKRTKLTDKLHDISGFNTDYQFITKRKMKEIQKISKGR